MLRSVPNWNETKMVKSKRNLVVAHYDTLSLEEQQRFVAFGLLKDHRFHKQCPHAHIRIRARAG